MIIKSVNLETVCGITSVLPENNRPEDLWVFFVYIRFLAIQVFEEISF